MKLILIRHGETQENVNGIVQGWDDTVLNATGRRQAKEAAEDFITSIDAIYSSDLKRCLQTADYFRKNYSNTPFYTDKRLRERNFGDAQGTRKDQYDWEVFWASNSAVSIPNAEMLSAYTKRVNDFLKYLLSKHKDEEKILVVTHGGTINRILDILKISTGHQIVRNCESMGVDLTKTKLNSLSV